MQEWESGHKYEGEWKLDQRSGYGVHWKPTVVKKQPKIGLADKMLDDAVKMQPSTQEITNLNATNINQDTTQLLDRNDTMSTQTASKYCNNVKELLSLQKHVQHTVSQLQNNHNSTIKSSIDDAMNLLKLYEGYWKSDLKHVCFVVLKYF